MIPTLIAFGLMFGRWWRTTLAVGVAAWVVVLLATSVIGWRGTPAAAVFALVNTAAGVLLHQTGLWAVRAVRSRSGHPNTA